MIIIQHIPIIHKHELAALNEPNTPPTNVTIQKPFFGFQRYIYMQLKRNTLMGARADCVLLTCDTLLLHTLTSSQTFSAARPGKLSLTPHCSDPCQASVTSRRQGLRISRTETCCSICLFICLCCFVVPSTCLSFTLSSAVTNSLYFLQQGGVGLHLSLHPFLTFSFAELTGRLLSFSDLICAYVENLSW